jgi:hypothetical protein
MDAEAEWDDGPHTWRHDLVPGDRVVVADDATRANATVIEWGRVDVAGMPQYLQVRLDTGDGFGIMRPAMVLELLKKDDGSFRTVADREWRRQLDTGDRVKDREGEYHEATGPMKLTDGTWSLPVAPLDTRNATRWLPEAAIVKLIIKAPGEADG